MAEETKPSIFNKVIRAADAMLDGYIEKARTNTNKEAAWDRKGMDEIRFGTEQQYGWKERRGLVGPGVLKNMARKDSIIAAIIQTRMNQISSFL